MSPIARGSLVALAAALLFGLTTPLVAYFGKDVGAFATAGCLYWGAALGSGLPRRRSDGPALRAPQMRRIAVVAGLGAALAPAALAWGLQHAGPVAASLLLNLEAMFTVLLAGAFYREPIGRRVALAALLMTVGGVVLALRIDSYQASSGLGLLALTCASLAWATDNTLTRPLADFDPRAVVFGKALLGAALSSAAAWMLGLPWPGPAAILGLLLCGATGYGFSLRLYLYAQRTLGAARTGSLFALGPFVGVVTAFAMGDRSGSALVAVSSALFAVAVYLHITEGHDHPHAHDALEHEHAHRHDDGHHTHLHDAPVTGEHSHWHRHEAMEHDHPHAADLHHRHRHD